MGAAGPAIRGVPVQIAIVLYPGLTALDAIGPYEVLRLVPGVEIRFVWHHVGPVVADSGVLVLAATHTLAETPRPDVVLVPGSGTATAVTARDEDLRAWLREVDRHTTWTTSVCTGSVVLAAAGLLEGRRATTHWTMQRMLATLGAEAQPGSRVVRDGKHWSAAGVSAGIDLGLALAAEIADRATAEAIQLVIEYDPQPPFDAGHPSKASAATKATALGLVAREGGRIVVAEPGVVPREVAAAAALLWRRAVDRARARRRLGAARRLTRSVE